MHHLSCMSSALQSQLHAGRERLLTREGTIWPCLIISATMLPSGVPDFMCARSRSPALRCSNPNSCTSFAHCGHPLFQSCTDRL